MRKQIKLLTIFLLILFGVVFILQYLIVLSYKKRVNQKFTKIFNHQADPEIMIFGSSVAYHELDPQVISDATGMSAYNMGWDGLFFVQYESLINEFLSYETKCKYIIIGNDFENFGKNDLITRPDLFLAYLDNDYVYNSLHEIEPTKMFRARYVPGYPLTLMNKSFYCDILFASQTRDSLSGYDPIAASFDTSTNFNAFKAGYEDKIYEKMKACIERIKEKGIKVVIVMMPVYKEGYPKILNAGFIRAKSSELAGKNVYFLDYTTDSITRSEEYFSNYSHLNKTGATLFSNTLSRDLMKIIKQ